jgi:DUF4097 and DUF4098 domain-containing protein YvlB
MMKAIKVISAAVLLVSMLAAGGMTAGKERMIEKSFSVEEGKKLDLEIDIGGDITITGWDRDEVLVKAKLKGRDHEEVELIFGESSSGIEIETDIDRKNNIKAQCNIVINVPRRFDISFETTGGDIQIMGVDGEISGSTCGGDLEFKDLKGTLEASTLGGEVSLNDCEVDGKVSTMGGDVTIDNVTGDLKGSTMGGKVSYTNVRSSGASGKDVKISSMGGDLNLDYAGKAIKAKTMGGDVRTGKAEKVDITTMGGDVDVEDAPLGAEIMTMGGDITVGSAGDHVKAKTMGGDIDISKIDGWIKAETMGGDIEVTMTGDPQEGKRNVNLKSLGGEIDLTVPAGLSMKFDIEIEYTKKCKKKPEIISDFDIDIEETQEWKKKGGQKRKTIYGKGKAGDGEHLVKIRTINGSVHIRKGK